MIKEIKNTMKAKAWIVMLLIGMISFTGFCYTPDLVQNSKIETVTSQDVIKVSDCVNVVSQINLVQSYRVYKGKDYFTVKVFKDTNCKVIVCGALIKAPDNREKPLITNNSNNYFINSKNNAGLLPVNICRRPYDINCFNPKLEFVYRRSRDSLRTITTL